MSTRRTFIGHSEDCPRYLYAFADGECLPGCTWPRQPERLTELTFYSTDLVTHTYHGPWSYEHGVCRGCGTGLMQIALART